MKFGPGNRHTHKHTHTHSSPLLQEVLMHPPSPTKKKQNSTNSRLDRNPHQMEHAVRMCVDSLLGQRAPGTPAPAPQHAARPGAGHARGQGTLSHLGGREWGGREEGVGRRGGDPCALNELMNEGIHVDLDTWIVPGQIPTGKPLPGSGKQLQTSRYRGVDLSRS